MKLFSWIFNSVVGCKPSVGADDSDSFSGVELVLKKLPINKIEKELLQF